jgi:hypothetical protein
MIDAKHERPREQWWLEMKTIASMMAKLSPENTQPSREFVPFVEG